MEKLSDPTTVEPCNCGWPGGTYGTNDPAIRRCDMCGGGVATDPATGDYVQDTPVSETTDPRDAVCAEVLHIMAAYHEQSASDRGLGTPGGLEHMGDVWRMLGKWERMLKQ